MDAKNLLIPVYINEKIVLDMLAIIEDGFSTVSQVSYTEHDENTSDGQANTGVSSTTIFSKLFKIDLQGQINFGNDKGKAETVSKEKIHTNVSLLSKFRNFLVDKKFLKTSFDAEGFEIGDFIEIEGELQKNPLINYIDSFVDVIRMANIFSSPPELGNKSQAKAQKNQENETFKQAKKFSEELKHSGTIDFILSDSKGTVVLSAQEQYLENDNVSELLGGRFKVLGKVIAICKNEEDSVDLLRKTSLAILSDELIAKMFAGFTSEAQTGFKLPDLITEIGSPAVIVIPVAIYA